MSEPVPIAADPISSDGSEESWILLDEMDEAMNEEFSMSPTSSDEQSEPITINEAASPVEAVKEPEQQQPAPVDETVVDYPSTVETLSSEAISANEEDDDNDDDDDNINDAAHLRSVLQQNNATQVYDDSTDESTTDGSISILGDAETNQSDDLAVPVSPVPSTSSPQPPLQMWMRCTPIDMTICAKRPLESRPYEPHRCQRPTSVEELGLPPQNIIEDIVNYLDRLNNFMSRFYLLQVFLLFLSAGLVTVLAVVYSRYSACKIEIKDLEQKLYSTKADKYQIEGNLARCEYMYEMELEKSTSAASSSEFKPATEHVAVGSDGKIAATTTSASCQSDDLNGECTIQPTKLAKNAPNVQLKTVWSGAGDDVLATKKPSKSKDMHLSECNDENSLFSEYNREYCENQKNRVAVAAPIEPTAKVYATHYSYKSIDDRECNPNKIDFRLGIEHARNVLRETNCDDVGTMKYLEKAYETFRSNLKNVVSKPSKEFRKAEKTAAKWEKAQKFNNSVIKIERIGDDENGDKFSGDRKTKRRADKKNYKEKDSDKENKRKNNDDTKKYYQDKDKAATGKLNKNDRKRVTVKVYDHRHDHN